MREIATTMGGPHLGGMAEWFGVGFDDDTMVDGGPIRA